jgi:hypothetical protein
VFDLKANEFDAFGLEDEEINILRTLILNNKITEEVHN